MSDSINADTTMGMALLKKIGEVLKIIKNILKSESALFFLFFCFSFWLMFHTFSYDFEKHEILIGSRLWSDFAATLPLIRSFSFSHNWPPEYPIYPGVPIVYHFLYFLIIGELERWGVPLHWALNFTSGFGFFVILLVIYLLGKKVFGEKRIGILGVLFFCFNGSLGFIEYFNRRPDSVSFIKSIFEGREFAAMGPWSGSEILGLWNLNIFTNQRHFAVALAFLFLFVWICLNFYSFRRSTRRFMPFVFGVLIGLLPLFHKPVLLMIAVVMTMYLILFPGLRKFLILTGVVASTLVVLQMVLHLNITGGRQTIEWFPGFQAHRNLTFVSFLEFWWKNFGLHSILIPLGFLFSSRYAKKVFAPLIPIFLVAVLFKFSEEILANHKFFNFVLALGQLYSAFIIFKVFDQISAWGKLQTTAARIVMGATVLVLTFSGIIDFFVVAMDYRIPVQDAQSSATVRWFLNNVPEDSVVLNSTYLYHPASIAGRKIFVGWAYFVWSAGYDATARIRIASQIYQSQNPAVFCPLLAANNIGYITVEDTTRDRELPQMNPEYFKSNFNPAFVSPDQRLSVYSYQNLCGLN